MMTLTQKLFSVAGLSTFITLLMGAGIVQAVPQCYMVNQAGQTVDLSYMCNQNNPRTQPQANQQAERTFSRRVPVDNSTSLPVDSAIIRRPQRPMRTYADIHSYVRRQRQMGNEGDVWQDNVEQDNVWQDVNYYNRFLEFPSAMSRRTAVRQEISPRVLGSQTFVNFLNADSPEDSRPFIRRRPENFTLDDFRNISSQYVLNGRGIRELRYYDLRTGEPLN
ncbi:MAG: hypothetical protein QNJ42_09285 [Crocosphaera sp.]|nr:hypothetical protein [Crocosphaera sp.]